MFLVTNENMGLCLYMFNCNLRIKTSKILCRFSTMFRMAKLQFITTATAVVTATATAVVTAAAAPDLGLV